MKTKLKMNTSISDLIDVAPVNIIEFEPFVPEEDGKFLDKAPTTIKLFIGYLEYYSHYNIEKEFIFVNENNLVSNNSTEVKPLKCEDQGILDKNRLNITRTAENILNPPEEGGTTVLYKVNLTNSGEIATFNFKDRTTQCRVYNELIKWKYGK